MFDKAIDSIFNINSKFNLKYSDHTFAFLIIFIKNFILICITLIVFVAIAIITLFILLMIFFSYCLCYQSCNSLFWT